MGGVLVLLRFVSLILVFIAIMLLGADLVTSLEKHGQITVRTVEQIWMLLSHDGPAHYRVWAENTLPAVIARIFESVLNMWSWVVVGVPGIVLAFSFNRRHHEEA